MDDFETLSPFERVVSWINGLAEGAVLVWGDDHQTLGGAHTGWVDVCVKDADVDLSWVWTIDDGTDPDMAGPLVVETPYDVMVWGVLDSTVCWLLDDPVFVTGVTDPLAGELLEALHDAAAAEPSSRRVVSRPGWSVAAIEASLRSWVAEHTGRTDVVFVYDATFCPSAAEVTEVLDRVDAGDEDMYLLAPGIQMTGTAFAQLLELGPDVAAELTGKLTELLGRPEQD